MPDLTVTCLTTIILEEHAIEYPDYQNHEELDIEIEKTENECSKSDSKISSADSGHQPSDPETDHHHHHVTTKLERKGMT